MTVEEMIDIVRNQYIDQIYALKAEAEKNWKELEVYKKAYEMVCNSLSDKTSCNWGYDEACKVCQEEGPEYRKTTSCVDNIKNFYLQKAMGRTIKRSNKGA